MNAPQGAAWREQLMFNAALWELMAKAKGLPAPWTLELFDGAMRPLERVVFAHEIDADHGVMPMMGSCDWPSDWRMPLTLRLTAGDGKILTVKTEEQL